MTSRRTGKRYQRIQRHKLGMDKDGGGDDDDSDGDDDDVT